MDTNTTTTAAAGRRLARRIAAIELQNAEIAAASRRLDLAAGIVTEDGAA